MADGGVLTADKVAAVSSGELPKVGAHASTEFPVAFWTANVIELCERAAYYGWFIMLAPFLTEVVRYSDVQAGYIGGCFAALLYLLPFVSGAFADRVGYRRALLLALTLLGCGYAGLYVLPAKHWVLASMALIMLGGALVKPIITGTVARSSSPENRARAFSLFYMMVNIGAFLGKTVAKPIRVHEGLATIPLLSAGVALAGFVAVALFYFPTAPERVEGAPVRGVRQAALDLVRDLREVFRSWRLLSLILITGGFWIIQSQMYSSMPKYVLRVIGPDASPEWYANINPIVVVLLVVPITQLSRRLPPIGSIAVAMALIPLSSLCIGLLPGMLGRSQLSLPIVGALHPVTLAMALGIAIQGLSECFLSPRYLEYASMQAPKHKEALYMGYAHLNNFFSWLFGYVLSGYLLNAFCPNPATLPPAEQAAHQAALQGGGPLPAAYAHASYLWLVFAGIGALALLMLGLFQIASRRALARAAEGTAPQLAA